MAKHSYLLGHPIAHSKSPALYAAAYGVLGLDWEYGLVDRDNEADAWEFIRAAEWLSINITTPWKRLGIQATSNVSVEALLAHGANLLINCDGAISADNVDGKGCAAFLRRSGFDFEGANVAVCGTGPTARAIMYACARQGAGRVTLLGRDAVRCAETLDGVNDVLWNQPTLECELAAQAYDQAQDTLANAQLIIDATPLGMKPGDPAPFDTSLLHEGHVVLDVVYGHGETQLVADARAAGCTVYDGGGMLVGQAVETVRALSQATGAFDVPEDLDLFQIMADGAGLA